MSLNLAKKAAGEHVLTYVEEGMTVGLGTGSTAAFFIEALGKKCQKGFFIQAIATSEKSVALAKKFQIPLLEPQAVTTLDLTIDGADEIDSLGNMIKGGGGALLREKITASMSKEFIVIVDENKCVDLLGVFPLPVEIVPYAFRGTIARLETRGYTGTLRMQRSSPYVTDSGHYIFDINNLKEITNPQELHLQLLSIVGVIETGLFFDIADKVIIGKSDGTCQIVEY